MLQLYVVLQIVVVLVPFDVDMYANRPFVSDAALKGRQISTRDTKLLEN